LIFIYKKLTYIFFTICKIKSKLDKSDV